MIGMLHRVTGLKGGQSFVYVDSIAYNNYEQKTYMKYGNMATDVSTATFDTRRLCHDEENRLTGVSDHDYLSYYQYDDSGERTYKTTMAYQTQTINGSTIRNKVVTYPTLYVSPYLVATEKG